MAELKVVGKSVPRKDAEAKVCGRAEFINDLFFPGMLFGKILRSPYPHALIKSLDYSEAVKLPGVYAVISGPEVGDQNHGPGLWDEPVLAKEKVRFAGEGVAAVAADSEKTAAEALKLIKVEYQELPAVFDVEESFAENPSVIIHPDLRNYYAAPKMRPQLVAGRPNVYHSHVIESGDPEQGFKEADLVLEKRFATARIQHCQMEPHVAIARLDANGNVTLWANTSTLNPTKNLFCNAFRIPPSKIRIFAPNIGGAFGGKQDIIAAGVAYALARETGKIVKVAFSREEVFIGAVTRHPMVIYVKDGYKKDGTLTARKITLLQNGGAYAENGYLTAKNATYGAVGTYRIPNFRIESYGVYTNEPVAGAFRGFGNVQLEWAIESLMDIASEKLKIDPIELRYRNILSEGELNPAGEICHSIGIRECIDKVAAAGYRDVHKDNDPGSPIKKGLGFAAGNKYSLAPTASTALVKVHEDARVEVRIGTDEVGQGLRTVISQIAAEEFGVGMDDIEMISGDSLICPYEEASVSSRSTYCTGNAVRLACADVKKQIAKRAAQLMAADENELLVYGKKVFHKDKPELAMDIHDLFIENVLAYGAYLPEVGEFLATATFMQGIDKGGAGINVGKRLTSFYTQGAAVFIVSVDTETGQITVDKMYLAFDMGRAVNPMLCEGQIEGGAVMGIGSALYEKMVLNKGRTLNASFTSYILPTSLDVPKTADQQAFLVEAPHRDGPYGAKGLGEATMAPIAPAICNAVYNAIGVRFDHLPISAEEVLLALQKKNS